MCSDQTQNIKAPPIPAPSASYNTSTDVEGYSGTIDLKNRPIVKNPDGSVSTERSMSFQDEDGKEVLIPTIVKGKELSKKEAIAYYKNSGEHMGKFNSPEEADAMAKKIHQRGYSTKQKMYEEQN